jgi:GABA(A) receptor-associated protein
VIKSQSFEKKYSFDKRLKEVASLAKRYPARIPVVIESTDDNQPAITKNKYLVPMDLSVSQFIYVIKKYITMNKQDAIFVFTKVGSIPPSSWSMSQLYDSYKSNDNFLYLYYSVENTFG